MFNQKNVVSTGCDLWIVNAKGGPDQLFEISVLRANNKHGIASYGWFGDDKIYISSSGGPCNDKVNKALWDRLVRVAEETAADLNAIEMNTISPPAKQQAIAGPITRPHSGKRLTELAFSEIVVGTDVVSLKGTLGKVVNKAERKPHEDDNWIVIDWNNGNQSQDEHYNFREVKVK